MSIMNDSEQTPYISVIVPVYNVRDYLTRCVDSFYHQGFDDFELILVDDGSTDGSGTLCDHLARTRDNILVVHKENQGLGNARNTGLAHARGRYVVFVDSDDYVSERYFSTILRHLTAKEVDILKYGYTRLRGEKAVACKIPTMEEGIYDRKATEDKILMMAIGGKALFDYRHTVIMSACCCAYRRAFVEEHQLRFRSEREILHEDYLFNLEALVYADTIEVIQESLYYYVYRDGSLSKKYVKDMLRRKQKLHRCYAEILMKNGLWERYKDGYYRRVVDSYYACITNVFQAPYSLPKVCREIAHLLGEAECIDGIKKVPHRDLSMKGYIIYYMMRYRMAGLITIFYLLAKKRG